MREIRIAIAKYISEHSDVPSPADIKKLIDGPEKPVMRIECMPFRRNYSMASPQEQNREMQLEGFKKLRESLR